MTEKQKRFCDEYLIDCNATRAYKAVYRNIKSDVVAATNGGRLLRNAEVQKYISDQMEELHSEKTADAQEVMEYLTSVLARDEIGAERVIEKPPDEKERLKAAELLGKRYGLYTEKVDLDADAELHICIDYGDGSG